SSITLRINSQSASVVSVNGLCGRIAALLIRISTRPNSDSALLASASTSAFFADIGENGDRFDPEISRPTSNGIGLLLIGARVDHDVRTFTGQLQYSRTADIASRSGHQRDLPFELAHALITPTLFASDPDLRLGQSRNVSEPRIGRYHRSRKCQSWDGSPA